MSAGKYEAIQKIIKECRFKTMKQIHPNKKNILEGTMLTIDPGSTNMGYALYQGGKLVTSGTFSVKSPFIQTRLKMLASRLRRLPSVDLLVTEYIHHPNAKTVPDDYTKLLKSIGCIMSNTEWKYCLEIAPVLWQDVIGSEFTKGTDEEDAIWIGEAVIRLADGKANT